MENNEKDIFNPDFSQDLNQNEEVAETKEAASFTPFSQDLDQNEEVAETKEAASFTPSEIEGTYHYTKDEIINDFAPDGFAPDGFTPNDFAPDGFTPPPPQKKEKKKSNIGTVLLCCILSLLIGGGSAVAVCTYFGNSNKTINKITENVTKHEIVSTSEELGVVEAVYKTASPSVVGIRATNNQNSFFESSGDGSGVIYSEDGYIITNYHVIAGGSSTGYDGTTTFSGIAEKISVFLSSDTEKGIDAEVVGYNSAYDIAVIKVDKKGLTPIKLGNSDKLSVGQFVVAIGSPGGLQFMSSATYGIISGLNRTLQIESETVGLIQTDAAINPGNSGGALVDTNGKLVGINSSKLVDTSFEGMGFAIPVNDVTEMVEKIINNEASSTPYIGIEISTAYESATLKALGFPAGAVVSSVTDSSPADKAGLKRADIITNFNGTEITGYEDFRKALEKCKPKDTVAIEIYRNGRNYKTTLTIGINNQVE